MKSSILFTILKKGGEVGEKNGNRLLIQQNLRTQPMLSFSKEREKI